MKNYELILIDNIIKNVNALVEYREDLEYCDDLDHYLAVLLSGLEGKLRADLKENKTNLTMVKG